MVLLLKVHRLLRLPVLPAEEEVHPPVSAACDSPWHHASHSLVWSQVRISLSSDKTRLHPNNNLRWVGGGHTTFVGFLNMGVHVFMYFYYFMSSFGPSVQKYLWWKR